MEIQADTHDPTKDITAIHNALHEEGITEYTITVTCEVRPVMRIGQFLQIAIKR